MSDFYNDFNRLVHGGYYVYVEGDPTDDSDFTLEAHDSSDDTHIIHARYNADGERISYIENSLVNDIIALLRGRK